MLIDSHAHILDPRLVECAEEIVNNLEKDGLECIVEISADTSESVDSLKFAEKFKSVYCSIGVHPAYASNYSQEFENWALAQKGNKNIVAFGECGLDYHYPDFNKQEQQEVFTRQIMLADKMDLPLIIHTRDAFDDTFSILEKNRQYLNNGIVLHCFSGDVDQVERFKTFDCYFAFGGSITYKNSKVTENAIKAVPRERLMLETDCPYLTPVPLRGQVNQPKNIRLVAQYIADVLCTSIDEIAKITTANTKRFYRINN